MELFTIILCLALGAPVQSKLPEGAVQQFGTSVKPRLFGGCSDVGIFAVAFSPDGRRIATANARSARVWDVTSGAELERYPNRGTVHSVRFTPDGKALAWEGFGNSFALVDLATDATVWEPEVGICVGFFLGFSADGKRLVSDGSETRGHRSDSLLVWDLEKESLMHDLRLPGQLWRAVITPDGRTVISGDTRGQVIFWDLASGKSRASFSVEGGAVLDLALSKSGEKVVAVSSYPRPYVVVADVKTARPTLRMPHRDVVRAVAISPDDRWIATAGNDKGIALFDAHTGKRVCELPGHAGGVSSLAFSPDGKWLLSGGFRGAALLWAIDSREGQLPR